MLFVVHTPRQVVDGADSPCTLTDIACFADVHRAWYVAKTIARPPVLTAERGKPENSRQEGGGSLFIAFPQPRAVQAVDLVFRLNRAPVPGRGRATGAARPGFHECETEPVRIDGREDAFAEPVPNVIDAGAVSLEPRAPVGQAPERDFECDLNRKAVPKPRRGH